MVFKFFISQKSKNNITKNFNNGPYLTWSKLERLMNTKRNSLFKVYLKAVDAVGGEIWKYCFLNDNGLETSSSQINQMSGFRVDFRHFQKHF